MTDNRMMIKIFVIEIKHQCEFAFIALNLLQQGLQQGIKGNSLVWFSLHSFLSATDNLSKIFWSTMIEQQQENKVVKEQFLFRTIALRKLFNIKSDSPLNESNFRNCFEHFDSRIQEWAMQSTRHNYSDCNIGHSGSISGVDAIDSLRNFNPENQTITFAGDELQLSPLIKLLEIILEKSKLLDSRPWWELDL